MALKSGATRNSAKFTYAQSRLAAAAEKAQHVPR
jgi:hypothetical protein